MRAGCVRVRAAKYALRGRCRILDCRHGLVEIVERRVVVGAERPRVIRPHPKRGFMTFSENASRHGYLSVQQRLGFLIALETDKHIRVIV